MSLLNISRNQFIHDKNKIIDLQALLFINILQVRFKKDARSSYLLYFTERMLATEKRKFIKLQMAERKSVTRVQRAWRRTFHMSLPADKTTTSTFDFHRFCEGLAKTRTKQLKWNDTSSRPLLTFPRNAVEIFEVSH